MIGPADAEISRVINEWSCGYVVANGDAAGLVQRLRELKADPRLGREMGARARRVFETQYDRPIACSRIESILRSLVEAG